MWRNRLFYLLFLIFAVVFFMDYRGWVSWFVLLIALCLPLLSLLLTLPLLIGLKTKVSGPSVCRRGDKASLIVKILPSLGVFDPELFFLLAVTDRMGGRDQQFELSSSRDEPAVFSLPTEHCGSYRFRFSRLRIHDFLRLFPLPVRAPEERDLNVEPLPAPPDPCPDMSDFKAIRTRPKAGGGFSEIHEIREYRPGDPVRQIHWKLSSKTDTLLLREPQEVQRHRIVLALGLSQDRSLTDTALSELLWLSGELLQMDLPHRIAAYDPSVRGLSIRKITEKSDLRRLLNELLSVNLQEAEAVNPLLSGRMKEWTFAPGVPGKEAVP